MVASDLPAGSTVPRIRDRSGSLPSKNTGIVQIGGQNVQVVSAFFFPAVNSRFHYLGQLQLMSEGSPVPAPP